MLADLACLVVLHHLASTPAQVDVMARELSMPVRDVAHACSRLVEEGLALSSPNGFYLTEFGLKRNERATARYDSLLESMVGQSRDVANPLPGKFLLKRIMGRGATSVTFAALQMDTQKLRTVKLFLPHAVTYETVAAALAKRAAVEHPAIQDIVSFGEELVETSSGIARSVPCIVLQHIDERAQTFSAFLKTRVNAGPAVLDRFIERIAGALHEAEKAGLTHGDLHDGNILAHPTDPTSNDVDFWLIDFVGVPSASSPGLQVSSDMENFRDHLLRAAMVACERYPGTAPRTVMGERAFRILEGLRSNSYPSFGALLEDFRRAPSPVPDNYFKPAGRGAFDWLRTEYISNPEDLIRLFAPFSPRFQIISRFGNTLISGPRGSGKSHYLRVLAFDPKVIVASHQDEELRRQMDALGFNFRRAFGVLIQCRLKEFLYFTPEPLGTTQFDTTRQRIVKHILILKIWNRTMDAVFRGMTTSVHVGGTPVLQQPQSLQPLVTFLEQRLGSFALAGRESDSVARLGQLIAACISRENSAQSTWASSEPRSPSLVDERDLDAFFGIIKRIFPDLSDTQFYILVDDASAESFHPEIQKVLNSLVRAAHSNHCFKITHEKFAYTVESSDGRPMDLRHEITYVDLGESQGGRKKGKKTFARTSLTDYMANVVDRRLTFAGYKHGITTILGPSLESEEFLARLVAEHSTHETKSGLHANYGGWRMICSLSHGSIRTLLEMIEAIFRSVKMGKNDGLIPLQDQDAALRDYARRQYRDLNQTSGLLQGQPGGKQLRAVIGALGQVSRDYLVQYRTGEANRWYETISIERKDDRPLSAAANEMLLALVRQSLLLDTGLNFARGQFGLTVRFDLNKAFVPAFATTFRVRNHLYLSHQRLEQLLLEPTEFLSWHREKLAVLVAEARSGQRSLGDYDG